MSDKLTVEVLHAKSLKQLAEVNLSQKSSISDVKHAIAQKKPNLYVSRQSIRGEHGGKNVKDDVKLVSLNPNNNASMKLYLKDLGPQVGWTTVFLTEYAGPLFIYLIFYMRPACIYGSKPAKMLPVVHYACYAWVFHYAKRLFETVFVHRFSNATMPIANIFKNSTYYWGFAAWVAYYINHPLYTAPMYGDTQVYAAIAMFIFNELGNLSVHVALRNLRPEGSKVRKIPYPTSNPFTMLFNFVSCPNYSYEVGSWIAFTIMCQSLPAFMFTLAGGYQMSVWALGKHRNYRKEFEKYPRGRKAIIPLFL